MSKIKVGINGFGRIGRLVFREIASRENMEVVAINDLIEVDYMAYMLQHDSVHGLFDGKVEVSNQQLVVNGQKIQVSSETKPADIPWKTAQVDVVIESTGLFLTHEKSKGHLEAGAKKVILSAPSKDDTPMVVLGVNEDVLTAKPDIISNASCTTNCIAPLIKVVDDQYEIVEGMMSTIHAATASQKTVDSPSKKNWRLGRSAINNIIPTSTGATKALGKVLPHLNDKLTGMSFRVPTVNVSVVDLTIRLAKPTSLAEINEQLKQAAASNYQGLIRYTELPLVSQDLVGDRNSCIYDASGSIELNPQFFKLVAWYDNEYGYSTRTVDLISKVI